nr:ABC transporter substrate-binding protein [Halovivax ruber]
MLALMGGSATVGLAGCSALLGDDEEDDEDGGNDGNDGDSDAFVGAPDDYATHADKAQAAWNTVVDNAGPEGADIRNESYVEIEEAVRDSQIMIPLFHPKEERFWYDYVDVPKIGPLGGHFQQHHNTNVEGDTELSLINATFDTLDPVMSDDTASSEVQVNIYETLTHFPDGVPELEDKLVEGYETSEDDLTWTFTLKQGVQFHDGTELTADDVYYSMRRLAESGNSVRASFVLDAPAGLGMAYEASDEEEEGAYDPVPDGLEMEVVDDYTFEFTIREPNPAVLDILSYGGFGIVPEGTVGDIEGYDGEVSHEEFTQSYANGTGPFELDYFTVGEDVRLTAFDNYHDGAPALDSVHWEIIEDDTAIWTYSMEQNADIIGVPQAQYDPSLIDVEGTDDRGREVGTYGPVENGEEVNYLSFAGLGVYYFAYNAQNVPVEVRQAIAYVTDHEELVNNFLDGRGFEAFSFTPPSIWPTGADGYEDYVSGWAFGPNETDRDSAGSVLEAAGFTEDDPFQVTCTTYESQLFQDMAQNINEKLSGLGVEMTLEETQFSTLQSRGEDGDLQMYSLGWAWSWPSASYGHFGFEPKNTDTSGMPGDNNGYYLDWQTNLEDEA